MYNTVVQKKFNLCYLVTELVIVAQEIVNYCIPVLENKTKTNKLEQYFMISM